MSRDLELGWVRLWKVTIPSLWYRIENDGGLELDGTALDQERGNLMTSPERAEEYMQRQVCVEDSKMPRDGRGESCCIVGVGVGAVVV
jgi:hypothetical protein